MTTVVDRNSTPARKSNRLAAAALQFLCKAGSSKMHTEIRYSGNVVLNGRHPAVAGTRRGYVRLHQPIHEKTTSTGTTQNPDHVAGALGARELKSQSCKHNLWNDLSPVPARRHRRRTPTHSDHSEPPERTGKPPAVWPAPSKTPAKFGTILNHPNPDYPGHVSTMSRTTSATRAVASHSKRFDRDFYVSLLIKFS